LPSSYGHDAFLVEAGEQTEVVRGFLASTFKKLAPVGAAR
jgi:homoserine acetyltransferase